MANKESTPEGKAMNEVCKYLTKMGYYFFRVNNGGIFDPVKHIMRKPAKWSVKGVADVFVVHKGKVHFIEVKSKVGKPSPDQELFCYMVRRNGCDYDVVRGEDDIKRIFPNKA